MLKFDLVSDWTKHSTRLSRYHRCWETFDIFWYDILYVCLLSIHLHL